MNSDTFSILADIVLVIVVVGFGVMVRDSMMRMVDAMKRNAQSDDRRMSIIERHTDTLQELVTSLRVLDTRLQQGTNPND